MGSISFLALILPLLPFIVIIIITIFVVRVIRRMEHRAEERLLLDKENMVFHQEQMKAMNELNQRLTNIETLLKDVD